MGRYILGKVSFTPKGEWNPETKYEYLDVVLYNGSGFVAKQDSKGVVPQRTENDYWMMVVERGSLGNATAVIGDDDGSGEPRVELKFVPGENEEIVTQFTFYNIKGKAGEKGEPNVTDIHEVVLNKNSWTNNTQTVTVNGIDVDEKTQMIDWVSSSASRTACKAAGIECISQDQDSLTFECAETPSEDLTIYVSIEPVHFVENR